MQLPFVRRERRVDSLLRLKDSSVLSRGDVPSVEGPLNQASNPKHTRGPLSKNQWKPCPSCLLRKSWLGLAVPFRGGDRPCGGRFDRGASVSRTRWSAVRSLVSALHAVSQATSERSKKQRSAPGSGGSQQFDGRLVKKVGGTGSLYVPDRKSVV